MMTGHSMICGRRTTIHVFTAAAMIFGYASIVFEAPGANGEEDKETGPARTTIFDVRTGEVRVAIEGAVDGNLSEAGAKEILTLDQFEDTLTLSLTKPVLLFKHSTTCEISGGAYRRLARYLKTRGKDAPPVYLVKVIERRPVSQKIAVRTKVEHESPQLILLDKKKSVWMRSHEAIDEKAIEEALSALARKDRRQESATGK